MLRIFTTAIVCSALLSSCTNDAEPQTETSHSSVPEDFVLIEGGTYTLGEEGHALNPLHTVDLDPFIICNHEVTNAEFLEFVEATGHVTTAEKHGNARVFELGRKEFEWGFDSTANWQYPQGVDDGGIDDKLDHPVTNISFTDALAYCEWKGVRLPTLDEWEVAARGGTSTKYFCGDAKNMPSVANHWLSPRHDTITVSDSYVYTSPIKSFQPNPFGLYDIYGNVFEFCSGKPLGYNGNTDLAFARGGSWWCSFYACRYFNSVDIGKSGKLSSFPNQGFRVTMDVE